MKLKLYFCQIEWSRWYENEEVIKNIYPYIDFVVVVDGKSNDGTIEGLKKITTKYKDNWCIIDGDNLDKVNWEDTRKNKMIIVDFPWRDDFIASRQKYIDVVSKLRKQDESSWFILSDTDEYLSVRLRKRLRKLCAWADTKRMKLLKVRCRSVELVNGKRIKENMDNYGKELIFKWSPDLAIGGVKVHHGFIPGYLKSEKEILELPTFHDDGKDREVLYEHRKDPFVIWMRSHFRNYFIFGGGPNLGKLQQAWVPLRQILDRVMPKPPSTWVDYWEYAKKGNVHQDLKDWYIRYAMEGVKDRDFTKWPKSDTEIYFENNPHPEEPNKRGLDYNGSSESREAAKMYFQVLFPEECPDKLKDLHIP